MALKYVLVYAEPRIFRKGKTPGLNALNRTYLPEKHRAGFVIQFLGTGLLSSIALAFIIFSRLGRKESGWVELSDA